MRVHWGWVVVGAALGYVVAKKVAPSLSARR